MATTLPWIERNPARLALLLGVPVVAGIVLGANQVRAGAYLPWSLSIVYWCTISVTTWLLLALATLVVRSVVRPWRLPDPAIWLLGAIIGSFLARPAIYAIAGLFRPLMSHPTLRPMSAPRFDGDFLTHYLTNWSVVILLWLVTCWSVRRVDERVVVPERADAPAAAGIDRDTRGAPHGILRRLPPALGLDVVALQAEDHYVRVHTRLGNTLLLASLCDAIEDVERSGVAGVRTHRSWWVATAAVRSHASRGRNLALILANGLEAPVSVSYRQLVAASGLLGMRGGAPQVRAG